MLWLYVKAFGGWWKYRDALAHTRNSSRRRWRYFVYTHFLEQHGSYISIGAQFVGKPRFPHGPLGIFVAPDARIGAGVVIYQNVTLGEIADRQNARFGAPVVGDDVFIGAGAIVIGNVTIGNGARIGAGAVVVDDVPEWATVVSPRATVVSHRPPFAG